MGRVIQGVAGGIFPVAAELSENPKAVEQVPSEVELPAEPEQA